jgi:hypothetical protein
METSFSVHGKIPNRELKGAGRHSNSWVRVNAHASKFHVNNDDEGKGSCFSCMHSLKFISADITSYVYDIRMR